MIDDNQIKELSQQIWQKLHNKNTQQVLITGEKSDLQIPIGVSNRHVHLSRQDMDILFGQGSSLTRLKAVCSTRNSYLERTEKRN